MPSASFPMCNSPKMNLPDTEIIAGRYLIDSDGNETPEVVSGKGFTVSEVSSGITRVTFNRKVKIIAFFPNVAQTSPVLIVHHKPLDDDNNYVDVVTTDYGGNLSAASQDTEMIDFIAVVMLTTSLPD
jgi:hypothetical protein